NTTRLQAQPPPATMHGAAPAIVQGAPSVIVHGARPALAPSTSPVPRTFHGPAPPGAARWLTGLTNRASARPADLQPQVPSTGVSQAGRRRSSSSRGLTTVCPLILYERSTATSRCHESESQGRDPVRKRTPSGNEQGADP